MAVLPMSRMTDSSLASPRASSSPGGSPSAAALSNWWCIYHGLDSVVVVQVSEVGHVGGVLAALAEAPVMLAPLGAEPPPFFPDLLHGVVPASLCAEDMPQVARHIALVPVADIAQYVAFQVGDAPLELGCLVSGKTSPMTSSSPLRPSAQMRPILPTPRSCRSSSICPQPKALSVGLLKMPSTFRVLSSFTARVM